MAFLLAKFSAQCLTYNAYCLLLIAYRLSLIAENAHRHPRWTDLQNPIRYGLSGCS